MNQQTAAAQLAAAQSGTESTLLDEIVEKSRVAKSESEHARAKDLIGELVHQVLDGTVVVSDNLSATIDAR
ncbi:type VI secretion system contractile sheath large subunit, partial [Pseudomonas veronii]|nr:type VI secretion system contractile sheath large subunit [Pseudomonas veronii]